MNVLVKYPSRARPTLFMRRVDEYLADSSVSLLCSCDLDDTAMNQPDVWDFLKARKDRVTVRWGNCKSKVEACNDGLNDVPWEGLVLLASDDMVPQRRDYARRILELFAEKFPYGDGVLHLNDGRVGRTLNTLCICDRKYYDRLGYLYRPASMGGYVSVYCDDEWQQVSERLGRAAYVDEVILFHNWIGETNPRDALHRRNEAHYAADGRTFQRRKKAGFPK